MSFSDRLRTTLWRCQAIVWISAWLVPRNQRAAWRSLQHRRFLHWCHFLSESGELTPQNRLLIARACWRLLPEAFWLRFDRDILHIKSRKLFGSPLALLLALSVALGLLTEVSGVILAVRASFSAPFPNADQIVTITLDGNGINGKYSRTRSDTLLDLAGIWEKSKLAEGLAPFSWAPAHLLLPSRDLQVATARVGTDFFSTLGVEAAAGRVFSPGDLRECPDCVVLSFRLWQHEFHADPNILGKSVVLNGEPRTVIGILPAGFRLLSPGVSVWGLIDPAMLFTNFQRRVGAVARLHQGTTPSALQRNLSDLTESAGYVHPSSQLQVVTVAAQMHRSLVSLVWFFLLATASAALVVGLRLASHRIGRLPDGAAVRTLWLGFFALKSSLLMALAALLAWGLVHWITTWTAGSSYPIADEYSIWLYLPLAIVALSWSVSDQRSRCRACLRRLEQPVEIGRTGSVLLNWAGTELVCPDGHGVLYLPDSPENALDQDRWTKLDESWESLFRHG